jgi:hypothetical protein
MDVVECRDRGGMATLRPHSCDWNRQSHDNPSQTPVTFAGQPKPNKPVRGVDSEGTTGREMQVPAASLEKAESDNVIDEEREGRCIHMRSPTSARSLSHTLPRPGVSNRALPPFPRRPLVEGRPGCDDVSMFEGRGDRLSICQAATHCFPHHRAIPLEASYLR